MVSFTPPLQRGALAEIRNWKPFKRFPILLLCSDTGLKPRCESEPEASNEPAQTDSSLGPVASTTPRGLPAWGPRSAPGSDPWKFARKLRIDAIAVSSYHLLTKFN